MEARPCPAREPIFHPCHAAIVLVMDLGIFRRRLQLSPAIAHPWKQRNYGDSRAGRCGVAL